MSEVFVFCCDGCKNLLYTACKDNKFICNFCNSRMSLYEVYDDDFCDYNDDDKDFSDDDLYVDNEIDASKDFSNKTIKTKFREKFCGD